MRKVFLAASIIALLAGCDRDLADTPEQNAGSITFLVPASAPGAGKTFASTPEKLVVSVEDKDGKSILEGKILTLSATDRGYSTEAIPLPKGEYTITKFLVLSSDRVTYASPKSGAVKAKLIVDPLPIPFAVNGGNKTEVVPNVVGVSSDDAPQAFGYTDFGYRLPDATEEEFLSVRVKLELYLGMYFYPNIDAPVIIRAFDENNSLKWENQIEYIGPEANDLKVKNGFHHYTIEFNKWGAQLTQTFTRQTLWEGRVREGVVPTTYVFQRTLQPKRLAEQVTKWAKKINGSIVMVPMNKTTYTYVGSQLSSTQNFTFVESTGDYILDSYSTFSYENGRVNKIKTWLASQESQYSEITYTYDDQGRTTAIQHKALPNGITTDVSLKYEYTDRVMTATYRLSNGTGFEYQFVSRYGSVKSDRTTRASQLCSEGEFTYDKNVNPMKHLGYLDYLLRNYSVSNRLTENVSYTGCSFPSLAPESYAYTYDEDGYPLTATTSFKGTWAQNLVEYTYNR